MKQPNIQVTKLEKLSDCALQVTIKNTIPNSSNNITTLNKVSMTVFEALSDIDQIELPNWKHLKDGNEEIEWEEIAITISLLFDKQHGCTISIVYNIENNEFSSSTLLLYPTSKLYMLIESLTNHGNEGDLIQIIQAALPNHNLTNIDTETDACMNSTYLPPVHAPTHFTTIQNPHELSSDDILPAIIISLMPNDQSLSEHQPIDIPPLIDDSPALPPLSDSLV